MPTYRIYFIDASDAVSGRAEAFYEDDASALTAAGTAFRGQKVEVWQGARKVGALEGRPAVSHFQFWAAGSAD